MLEEIGGVPETTVVRETEEYARHGAERTALSADGSESLFIWNPHRSTLQRAGHIDHASIEVLDNQGHSLWQWDLPANQEVYSRAADDRLSTVAVS